MQPIFEVPVPGRCDEVRVGGDVYPVFTPHKYLGRTCRRAALVEAPLEVGVQQGWTRRIDVEAGRKAYYLALGAAAADAMRQADAEGLDAERQAREDAERQAREAEDAARAAAQPDPAADAASSAAPSEPAPATPPATNGRRSQRR
ncbi:MAG TPA: hypothetical protein VM364_00565 [Vicinamibacterales bacterium]|nr:hypothetical protein [Vicinamibacterales bacterium]